MIKDDVINVKTCVLRVGINCPACEKKVKKIIHKVDGVYQSTVSRDGKVTVSGLMDPDMVIKKLRKAGKRAELWGAEPQMLISQPQKGLLGSTGGDQQPKDGDKVQISKAGADVASSSGAAKYVMPAEAATPQQLLRQQMMKALMAPSGPPKGGMGANGGKASFPVAAPPPPAMKDPRAVKFNIPEEEEFEDDGELYDGSDMEDFEVDGLDDGDAAIPIAMPSAALLGNKRGGGGGGAKEIPAVQVKAKANNTAGKVVVPAMKQNLGGGGVRIANNGGGAQPPPISKAAGGAPSGSRNKPGQANKVGATGGLPAGVRGPKMGGMPPPQQPGMMTRPPNMMGGGGGGAAAYPGMNQMGGWPMGGMAPTGHPHMASNGMQPAGGSAIVHGTAAGGGGMMPGAGFYPGGAGGGVAGGGMASAAPEQYMPMMPQHQPQMMMNGGHGPHCHHVHGCGAGYPPQMGCGYGHPPPAYYPPPMPRHPHDNMFSDENPNSYCSVM